MIENLLILYVAGIFGSIGMDLFSPIAARFGFKTGVSIALIGRWVLAISEGKLSHEDIRHSRANQNEDMAGWLFHYLIGGGAVALLFVLWMWIMESSQLTSSPIPYLCFGLATSILPWLILMPLFGWGLFGSRAPKGSQPLVASPLNHLGYGLGMWCGILITAYRW